MRGNNVAVAGFVIHLVSGALSALVGIWAGSQSALYLSFPLLGTGAVWGLVFFHQRQKSLSELEEEAIRNLTGREAASRMFEDQVDESFSARNRLRQMERWFLPSLTLLAALAMLAVSLGRFTSPFQLEEAIRGRAASSSVLFAAVAFALFIFGRYAGGLAAAPKWRHMEGGAAYSIFCSIMSLAVFAGLIFLHLELPSVERLFSYLIPAAAAAISVELMANFVLHLYKPPASSAEYQPPYSSRLLAMLARPSGAMKTVAEVLDYQFGFQISETWFYRLVEKVIAPIILFQIISFYGLTCLLVVKPGEEAVVERFGVPRHVAQPGLHVKLPWPLERTFKHPTGRVHSVSLGAKEEHIKDVILWTDHHHNGEGEDNFIVASRELESEEIEDLVAVNLLNMHVVVKYVINDIMSYLYSKENPEQVIEWVATRELTRFVVSADIFEIMGPGRFESSLRLRREIERAVGETGLGIRIIYAGFENVHPPAQVADSFQEVVGAMEQKHAEILKAEAYSGRIIPLAGYHARVMETEAGAYKLRRQEIDSARADRYTKQLEADGAAPRIYRIRKLMPVLEESLPGARKYVVPARKGAREVTIIDLARPGRPDLLDIDLTGLGERQ